MSNSFAYVGKCTVVNWIYEAVAPSPFLTDYRGKSHNINNSLNSYNHLLANTFLAADHFPWCDSPVPLHPKGALLEWNLVVMEAIWVQWTLRHVQETIVRILKPCNMLDAVIRRWLQCGHKEMDMVSNNTQGRLWCLKNAWLVLRAL